MTRLFCWLVTRRLETILWFSVPLGLLTTVPVIGIIAFELFIPTLRVSWLVIIFAMAEHGIVERHCVAVDACRVYATKCPVGASRSQRRQKHQPRTHT